MEKRRTKILWLTVSVIVVCILAAVAVTYTRLPDISAETTVPLVFEIHGQGRQYLLGAWQPEKATLEIGKRSIATADTQENYMQYFAHIPSTGKLVWWSGDTNATTVAKMSGLKAWNSSVVMPLTSYPPVSCTSTIVWWWSGHDAAVTTARIEWETISLPLSFRVARHVVISDSTGKTCTADFPQNPAPKLSLITMLAAGGDLQNGFALFQWHDLQNSTQHEYLFLVRLQNGKSVTHEVAHDSNYDPKDFSTWILELAADPPDWTCAGTTLYLCPKVSYGKSNYIWTLDMNAAQPTVRLEQTLTSLADSLPSVYPLVALGAVGRFSLISSGPYLLLSNGGGDTWALQNDKVVGHLHRNAGTISAEAGTQSATYHVRNLNWMGVPDAMNLGSFFLTGY
jgi:hypothetical protein